MALYHFRHNKGYWSSLADYNELPAALPGEGEWIMGAPVEGLPDVPYEERRKRAYEAVLPVQEQLDAILKWVDSPRFKGNTLPDELKAVIEKRAASFKEKYPRVS